MVKVHCVGEHERIEKTTLNEAFFSELCEFAKDENGGENSGENKEKILKFVGPTTLKTTQFVGVIQTKSATLEILPKTYKHALRRDENSITAAKNLLLKMLKTLEDSPFERLESSVESAKLPLLEIFAEAFCQKLDELIKKGIESKYIGIEENRRYLKGRLLLGENLRQNFAHKERFYTLFDEYSQNIAQNRLIKSTLMFLQKQDFSPKIYSKILEQRAIFEHIEESKNFKKDFLECDKTRAFRHYFEALSWCKIFLENRSFSPYSGDFKSFALLFDMNKLFESFVAHALRKNAKFKINAQVSSNIFWGDSSYKMRPDILVFGDGKCIAVLDTKWKIIDGKDISNDDIYQVFSYGARFCNAEKIKVALVYPKIDGATQTPLELTFKADENIKFSTHFWDVENDDSALELSLRTITTQAPNCI